jgi:hypothetical protein
VAKASKVVVKGKFVKGHAKVGGRQKGVQNKATRDVRELIDGGGDIAQVIAGLFRIALFGETEPGRVAASKELLDRRYGKAPQAVVGDPNGAPVRIVTRIELVAPGHAPD